MQQTFTRDHITHVLHVVSGGRFAGEFVECLREGGSLRVRGTAIGPQIRLVLV